MSTRVARAGVGGHECFRMWIKRPHLLGRHDGDSIFGRERRMMYMSLALELLPLEGSTERLCGRTCVSMPSSREGGGSERYIFSTTDLHGAVLTI